MASDLLVGCPVRNRTWIIKQWFDHVEHACRLAGVEPGYVFVADPDDETAQLLAVLTLSKGRECHFVWTKEDLALGDLRTWDPARFERMVELRNQLLGQVRELAPDRFLSLDSDILLHPQVVKNLLESTKRFDAVGGATYMTPSGLEYPSCGWNRGSAGFVRRPIEAKGVIPVGVIMAIKAMTPAAYAVDYQANPQGEDIGWSLACEQAGVRLAWDNRYSSKHVMAPADLNRIDERCGW